MVSKSARQQIVIGVVLTAIAIVIILGLLTDWPTLPHFSAPVFSATANDLDLAILDGIVGTEKAFKQINATKAVVVPHHLVASQYIALGIKSLAVSAPKIVVIISPDHFARCPTFLCTTRGSYTTFFGDVNIDDSITSDLEQSNLVSSSALFEEEHGISTIVPYIKHYLPQVSIVPIVISQNTRGSQAIRTELLQLLQPLLSRKDVALVISSDFSHYLPLAETRQKDAQTQTSFCSGNSEEILNLDNPSQSDCPLCLWILEQQAKQLRFWNPVLLSHTNSAELMHDTSAKELTSHFVFALSSQSVATGSCPSGNSPDETQLLFVGDMSFDRFIRQTMEKRGSDYPFSCIDSFLQDADYVVGNLEGPITPNTSVSQGTAMGSPDNYRFTFPTETAELLFRHNITIVNIGNNHIDDFGPEGIVATKKSLTDARVSYFGGLASHSDIYRITNNGISVSFVNYNQFGGDSPEKIAKMITEEHASGRRVIVYTHWGDEYTTPTKQVRSIAKLFVLAGADLIIGSHPHVIQEHEMIDGTPVYYSLGNFIFDQYFEPSVTKGLALLVNISQDKIAIIEKPLRLYPDGRTCLIHDEGVE